MAKSADAADLKSAGRKAVGVQVPLRAPIKSITYIRILRWRSFTELVLVPLLVPLCSDFARIAFRRQIPCAEEDGSQGTRRLREGARLRHLVDSFLGCWSRASRKVGTARRRNQALQDSQGGHSSQRKNAGEHEGQGHQVLRACPESHSTGMSTTTAGMFGISNVG